MKINSDKYKNIIFDLGGVILNINYANTIEAFKQLGIKDFDKMFSQAQQEHLFDKYEKGQITTAEFREKINNNCNNRLSDEQIDKSWNALLLDLPPARLALLERIKHTYRTFLLSNTTELHINAFYEYLKTNLNIDSLDNYFEKVYLSYKIGMRKPDLEIFQRVLTENNLVAAETLFIDDSIQHIKAASTIGIQTYWLDIKKESILDLFI